MQTREAVADAGRAGRANARIGSVLQGFELLEQSRSLFDRNILVCIPGYSKDGRLAVVLMEIQWSIHPLPTAQVLVEEDGRWRVVQRSFGEPVFGTVGP